MFSVVNIPLDVYIISQLPKPLHPLLFPTTLLWGSSYYLRLEMGKEVTFLVEDCPGREGRMWMQSQAFVLGMRFSLPYHPACSETLAGPAKLHIQPNLWASHAGISQEVLQRADVWSSDKAVAEWQLHFSLAPQTPATLQAGGHWARPPLFGLMRC